MKKKRRRLKKITWILIFALCLLCLVLYAFFSRVKTNHYQFKEVFKEIITDVSKDTQAYKDCMNSSFDNYFSQELLNKKNDLLAFYNSDDAYFVYTDLTDGYSFGYGVDFESYAASVNKLPAVFYVYHLADDGKLDLNKELVYSYKYYMGGTGVIQDSKIGTKYSIKTLLEDAIRYSDNIAYSMILDEIGGTENVQEYWNSLGYKITYTDDFGNLTPNLGNGYIKEIYKYYLTGNENAKKLITDMENSMNLDYVQNNGVTIAHKYGEYVEGGGYYNDVSLVFTDHPFALSILTTKGNGDTTKQFFLETHEKALEFNKLYYEEKENYCLKKAL